jgi:hypothetical protein
MENNSHIFRITKSNGGIISTKVAIKNGISRTKLSKLCKKR